MSETHANFEPAAVEIGAVLEQLGHWNSIGRHDLALERARTALQSHPADPDLLVATGFALEGLKRPEEAADAARSALGNDPTHLGALALLARLAQAAGRHREAEQHYLTALAQDPEQPWLLLSYAQLMFKVGQSEKSEALTRAALTRDPDYAAAHSFLALVLTDREQKSAQAQGHGAHGLRLEPDSDFSHFAMGVHLYDSGRPFQAKRHLREALRLDPTPDVENAFLEVDRATRWVYLPMYYWGLLIRRLPGRQFAVWGAFLVFIVLAPALGLAAIVPGVAIGYIALCVYTWLAGPLVKLWVRWRPPR
jgi:tetratricopeptide (TPR) repeat protein